MTVREPNTDLIGHILTSPKSGISFVPFDRFPTGYNCVVVDSGSEPENQHHYPVGGYHIFVNNAELTTCNQHFIPIMSETLTSSVR